MNTILKKIFVFAFVTIFAVFLNGCQTMEGLGKDVQTGGKALEKAAKQDNNDQNNNGQSK